MTSLPPEGEYPMEISVMFIWCRNLMFLGENRFSNSSFCWLLAVQSWYLFGSLWASPNWPYPDLFTALDMSLLFYWVWIKYAAKKQFKLSPFDNNSRTMRIRSGTSHCQWSIQWESRTVFLVNKQTSRAQSFISICNRFFWF